MAKQACKAQAGLNPFEFRAGIQSRGFSDIVATRQVLIPLNSGLEFNPAWDTAMDAVMGLNPFEFRAGIQSEAAIAAYHAARGLNPFEFRAGIQSPHC